ncbi:MAG: hypothetical protein EHM36_07370 [Deltaproteobacteria bacterium]|nr:MAG: hypothetical protein EHM36_07370 [Deltaproteobacteria bacterium]
MRRPTKKEIMEKYQAREPRLFVEIDALKVAGNEANLMRPDEDGFWFQARPSYELMDGADLRILINPQTDRKDAVSMLNKVVRRLDQDWSRLLENTREELAAAHGIEGIAESLIRIRGFQLSDFERLFRVAREKLGDGTGAPPGTPPGTPPRTPDEEWPFAEDD